ncbi:hypothetical protein B9T31_06830 [Acinetobacter sp. ANC 4558]|uniref:DUF2158 domain-containing protein n=1 Tax=Acinetobacter stercoris TaxID=2126983 RepID=A0A2U3MV55_9GAMM|nr:MULTISPECIES: DUF2158 domain-containing protein [Acinetobacter]OTG86707.1 hypothetical protein B9T31_06830 [Acinetobacter sp. ANC 4558]SPL69179.1 hypothetical protein KPC_0357 [Acinetobacter stercoris]
MSNFQEGDIVELKSGSPNMTITEINGNGYAVVAWYCYDSNEIKTKPIETTALKKKQNS